MQNKYKHLTPEQLEELLSHFLINSWSYSKLASFARNEKGFEMQYIFGLYSKSSATTIAGKAYHLALQYYFTQKQEGKTLDIVELEAAAFQYIDEVPGNYWKLQKTTPTVDACIKKAMMTTTALIKNFMAEKEVYEEDLAEVLDVEVRGEDFVTINGVDIPLPLHFVVDLVIKTKSGKTVIIDHKSKSSFTDEEEIVLNSGVQAMTYVIGYEQTTGLPVDEVWFVENKYSQNKDKTAGQLNAFKFPINDDTRRLHEALLYEPLKRMLEAVNDPDYVYLINSSDNLIDKAELYDFWCRSQLCEVEDFNVEESKKGLVQQRLRKIRDASVASVNPAVIKKFKANASAFIPYDLSNKDMTQEQKIEHVLRSFGVNGRCAHTFDGYSSNTCLLEFSAGVKISSISSYNLDIANALGVEKIRVPKQLKVHEGKSYLPIEFSKKRDKDLLFNPEDLVDFKIPIGKDNYGNTIVWDLANNSTPHALICGQTGSGKSVCLEAIIEYAKLAKVPDIIVLDPKYEFMQYRGLGVDVFNEIAEIEEGMERLVKAMNDRVKKGIKRLTLIVFDEFADAVAQSRNGRALDIYEELPILDRKGFLTTEKKYVGTAKTLEENMQMLLQKGRSSGFRIAAGTQRASTKVINGESKVNFPVQICFRVPKTVDSMVVLDEAGAETLAGKGDGLIKSPEYADTVRFQGYYKP